MAAAEADRRERGDDRGAGDSRDDRAVAQADARATPVVVGFDALDVGEVEPLVVEGHVGAVLGVLGRRVAEPLPEHLGTHAVGHLALGIVGVLGFVHVRRMLTPGQGERDPATTAGSVLGSMSLRNALRRLTNVSLLVAVALVGSIALAGGTAAAASGSLSSVTVQGAEGEKPTFQFAAPFAASSSSKRVITTGTGEVVTKGAKVTIEYVVVDGRTGKEVDSSYGTKPVAVPLDTTQVAPVLVKSLTGVKVGSRVLLAIAPKEGLAKNLAGSGVKKNDTLLFLADVKTLHRPLARAEGEKVTPAGGLPSVKLGAEGKPTITVPKQEPAPKELVTQPLIKGSGAPVAAGETVTVHYTGVLWDNGKQFDSTWDRGKPADVQIGTGNVMPGLDTGLVGQTVGSQVLLVVPPDEGYGSTGSKAAGVSGTDTLVFVVDILDAI